MLCLFHNDDWLFPKKGTRNPTISQGRAGQQGWNRSVPGCFITWGRVLSRVSRPLAKRLSSLSLRFHSLWVLWILSHVFFFFFFFCDGGLQGSCCSTRLQPTLFDIEWLLQCLGPLARRIAQTRAFRGEANFHSFSEQKKRESTHLFRRTRKSEHPAKHVFFVSGSNRRKQKL